MSRPTAAPPWFPYDSHRTLAEVDLDERAVHPVLRPQPQQAPRCSWCDVKINHRIVRTCMRRTCPAKERAA